MENCAVYIKNFPNDLCTEYSNKMLTEMTNSKYINVYKTYIDETDDNRNAFLQLCKDAQDRHFESIYIRHFMLLGDNITSVFDNIDILIKNNIKEIITPLDCISLKKTASLNLYLHTIVAVDDYFYNDGGNSKKYLKFLNENKDRKEYVIYKTIYQILQDYEEKVLNNSVV